MPTLQTLQAFEGIVKACKYRDWSLFKGDYGL
jgi:hypothetical protein